MFNWFRIAVTAFAAVFIALMIFLAFHFYGKSVEAKGQVNQLQSDNALQTETISTQAFNFQRSNQIAGAAQLYSVQIVGKSQEKEIEYRRIIEKEPTCDLLIPADIASGLLGYTHRLRATALHANTSDVNSDGSTAAATSSITYCQAVLWIRPLLATIDQANNQLADIARAEESRNDPR